VDGSKEDDMHFCDYCRDVIWEDDAATIKIEEDGVFHEYDYHNSLENPCLNRKIEELRRKFAQQKAAPLN
jgi:hypothetical protein